MKIECTITMILIEGRDFLSNKNEDIMREDAEETFLHLVKDYISGGEVKHYVQSRIIDEND